MTKILAWFVLIVVVLFALRLVNQSKARARRKTAANDATAAPPETTAMVRCARCGVFLPRGDARLIAGQYTCPDNSCAHPR